MSERDRLSPEALKNKIKYNIQYDKGHYKRFVARLKPEEYDSIDAFIKKKAISKAEFIRWAYDKLKKEQK